MNQFVKFLPGIGSLVCVAGAMVVFFVGRETTWALLIALLGLVVSQIPAPGTAARKRAAQEAAQNREDRKVRAQRRRLLADVQIHQRNVARKGTPDASR